MSSDTAALVSKAEAAAAEVLAEGAENAATAAAAIEAAATPGAPAAAGAANVDAMLEVPTVDGSDPSAEGPEPAAAPADEVTPMRGLSSAPRACATVAAAGARGAARARWTPSR